MAERKKKAQCPVNVHLRSGVYKPVEMFEYHGQMHVYNTVITGS